MPGENELTYFAKGLITGVFMWLLLLIFVVVRGLYLMITMQDIGQEMFYVFSDSMGVLGVIVYGVFLIVAFGIIGWVYGRVVGERV